MKKILKTLMVVVLTVLILGLVTFGGLLGYLTLTNYNPEPVEKLDIEGNTPTIQGNRFTALIWNVGYSGLGKEMDFFYDGGTTVRATKEQTEAYLNGIASFLAANDSVDFMMLQEVDKNSKRSYYIDQQQALAAVLPKYTQTFALNYDCAFVPMPLGLPYTPYGKTYGGLLSFSKYLPNSATRYQFPGSFGWPTNLAMLRRCMLVWRYKLPNGKDLLMVNTHNTAYDETGDIKKQELLFMKNFFEAEYANGNYIVVGGDWNQVPLGFSATAFNKTIAEGYTPQSITQDLVPKGFAVVYDPTTPTNRSNKTAYTAGQSYTTLIDYFMVSPNIKTVAVKTHDMGFAYSDHQPMLLTFELAE